MCSFLSAFFISASVANKRVSVLRIGTCVVGRWILKNLGDDLTEADIDDMIADVDTDGSGWVDYNGTACHHYNTIIILL